MNIIKSFDGAPIAYDVNGSGSPTLVFVHGFSCDRTFWSSQISFFSNKYHVVSLDLAGHGKSGEGNRIWNMENYGKDVAAVCNHLELDSFILIGHSMGGAVIVEAANLIKNEAQALIGVDSIIYQIYSEMEKEDIVEIVEPLEKDFKEEAKRYIEYWFPDQTHPDLAMKVYEIFSSTPLSVSIPTMRSLLQWDFQKPLSRTQVPIFCICSERTSSEIDLTDFEERMRIHTLSGVGHMMMLEDPNSFNTLLDEVIDLCESDG
jgi:pimeloyl-ACP methyl ester carboxylesterase